MENSGTSNAGNIASSGDGTRPTTDGGVDNIGAAGGFNPGKPESQTPAPREKFTERKQDRASAKEDGFAPLGIRQPASSTPNTEPAESNPGRASKP